MLTAEKTAEEMVRTTCPRDCYDACGIQVVRRGGVILKIMGDPAHPYNRGSLCGKCTLAYNGAWRDPEARLLHPLKRVGPKGSGEFVRISWDEALLAELLRQSGCGLDFAALSRVGTVYAAPDPIVPFADGRFATPSGKIEIASDAFEAEGLPRAPQPWADARPAPGKLRLLSPASPWRMNSSYDNDAAVRRRTPSAEVTLNPWEASARGLSAGMSVIVSSESGRLPLQVAISEDVPRGVALVHKGRWPKLDPSHANVNVLNPGRRSDMGDSSAVHSVEVEIRQIAEKSGQVAPEQNK